jgi:hypothetical protein
MQGMGNIESNEDHDVQATAFEIDDPTGKANPR